MQREQFRTLKKINMFLISAKATLEDIGADERIKAAYSPNESPQKLKALNNVYNINRALPGVDVLIDLTTQLIKENEGVKFDAGKI